jgi:hypothetical protein
MTEGGPWAAFGFIMRQGLNRPMSIPLTIPLRGTAGPLSNADNHAVTDPLYGIKGLRSANDTIQARKKKDNVLTESGIEGPQGTRLN